MKSILDPTFRYIPSIHTDIARTFARVRREQLDVARAAAEADPVEGDGPEACEDWEDCLVLLRADYGRAYLVRLSGDPSSGSDYPRIRSCDSQSAP